MFQSPWSSRQSFHDESLCCLNVPVIISSSSSSSSPIIQHFNLSYSIGLSLIFIIFNLQQLISLYNRTSRYLSFPLSSAVMLFMRFIRASSCSILFIYLWDLRPLLITYKLLDQSTLNTNHFIIINFYWNPISSQNNILTPNPAPIANRPNSSVSKLDFQRFRPTMYAFANPKLNNYMHKIAMLIHRNSQTSFDPIKCATMQGNSGSSPKNAKEIKVENPFIKGLESSATKPSYSSIIMLTKAFLLVEKRSINRLKYNKILLYLINGVAFIPINLMKLISFILISVMILPLLSLLFGQNKLLLSFCGKIVSETHSDPVAYDDCKTKNHNGCYGYPRANTSHNQGQCIDGTIQPTIDNRLDKLTSIKMRLLMKVICVRLPVRQQGFSALLSHIIDFKYYIQILTQLCYKVN